ncbi:MAG: hypothetical protein JF619_01795 [Massilia sp.]|nr:hypothetical protein [Massilia sp.]
MFVLTTFMNQVRQDNPTYGRVKTSSLHDLVAVLSAPPFTAADVATELKSIMRAEPGKLTGRYARSYAYLRREIPGLIAAMRANVFNFRTESILRGMGGTIVHRLVWESDTGDLADLAHIRVREHVSWPTPTAPVIPNVHIDTPDVHTNYRIAGFHTGVGNAAFTPGPVGNGNDTHGAYGPFSPACMNYTGAAPLVVTFTQVYQSSADGGTTWIDIPNSRYTIRRELRRVGNRTQVTITKTNVARPRDAMMNTITL